MATFPSKVNYATGDVLTATNMNDVGGALNLLESAQFAAGKNKIINGAFNVWQRGTTFSFTGGGGYAADRWEVAPSGATMTVTQQTFTPGTAPVSGYEGTYFLRMQATVADDNWGVDQKIEDVRTFAGQTVTISFWAKADSARTLNVYTSQNFGSGGSTAVSTAQDTKTLSTSWQRFTSTVSIASVAGKTIGTSSFLQILFRHPVNAIGTVDIWGVQVEAASTASPFQTASGSIGGELALCQRYYYRTTPGFVGAQFGAAAATSSTVANVIGRFPVTMRTKPTALEQSGTANQYAVTFSTVVTACSAVPVFGGSTTENDYQVNFTVASGLTAGQAGRGLSDTTNGATAYLGWSAEL
jgi:hypothetical protein